MIGINKNWEEARLVDLLINIVEPNKDTEVIIRKEILEHGTNNFLNNLGSMDIPIDILKKIKSLKTIVNNFSNMEGRDID